jgi:predicted CopG family antitoxin
VSHTIEISDDLRERLDRHLEDDESYAELIEELVNIYESSRFVQEGYSE